MTQTSIAALVGEPFRTSEFQGDAPNNTPRRFARFSLALLLLLPLANCSEPEKLVRFVTITNDQPLILPAIALLGTLLVSKSFRLPIPTAPTRSALALLSLLMVANCSEPGLVGRMQAHTEAGR